MATSPLPKPCLCWHCGFFQNSIQHLPRQQARPPRDGDISLCAKCGAPARYDDGTWRGMTEAELRALPMGVRQKLAVAQVMQRHGIGRLDQPEGHA